MSDNNFSPHLHLLPHKNEDEEEELHLGIFFSMHELPPFIAHFYRHLHLQ
ncbi:hypothetical protein SESBI_22931 [Sesbania bispinosa]|nr:hypothetical protein SESBI_22931 [Sesbania bispinosa]